MLNIVAAVVDDVHREAAAVVAAAPAPSPSDPAAPARPSPGQASGRQQEHHLTRKFCVSNRACSVCVN